MTAPITSAARRNVQGFSVSHAAILDRATGLIETDIFGVRTASMTPQTGTADITGDDRIMDTWNWFEKGTLNIESGYLGFDLYAKISGTTVDVGGTATSAYVQFTPAASGGAASGGPYDYSGPAAITFTVDGHTVTLNADETNLAGVVAAVDAALSATYTVTTSGGGVRIALATPGVGNIVIAGTDAADVTGSAGYANVAGSNASQLSVPFWQEDASNQPPYPALVRMPSRDGLGNPLNLDVLLYRVQLGILTFQGPQYKTGLTVSLPGTILMSSFDEQGNALPKAACGRLISATAA